MKLIVSARSNMFRRGGHVFGPNPTAIEVDDKMAAVLKAEPMLVVVDPAALPPVEKSDKGKK